MNMQDMLEALVRIVRQAADSPVFNILEIGALPVNGKTEPFHGLLASFPGSRINAFEIDTELCNQLNDRATNGLVYHAVALGQTEEERPFYITNHPMCSSLYKPNEKLIGRYNNMEVAGLKTVSTIKTVSLDYFTRETNLGPVDFIKIDIQGAELDVFRGGTSTLGNVLAIVSEVEFVPQYEGQPLFGDVCAFLDRFGLTFHKFLGMGNRCLKPIVLNNDLNFGTQNIWADAIFLRDLSRPESCSSGQILKLAVLAALYNSVDVTIHCLMEYDRRNGTDLAQQLVAALFKLQNPAASGHATADAVKPAATATGMPVVGRNDPCPCGSGKKYRQCHGDISREPSASQP